MSKPKIIQDIENIEDKIDVLSAEVEQEKEGNAVHLAEKATLTQEGHVQLSNAINSTSNSLAATPSAVKQAYDRADEAFTLGNSRKQELVDLLLSLDDSLPINQNMSWEEVLIEAENISTGKKWAKGEVVVSSDTKSFERSGGTISTRYLRLDNLSFTPSIIIAVYVVAPRTYASYVVPDSRFDPYNSFVSQVSNELKPMQENGSYFIPSNGNVGWRYVYYAFE